MRNDDDAINNDIVKALLTRFCHAIKEADATPEETMAAVAHFIQMVLQFAVQAAAEARAGQDEREAPPH